MRLDIPVHDTFAVAEIQSLQQLEDVVADIIVDKSWIESAEIGVVDILEDQAGCLALTVPNHVQQGNNIRAS